MKRELCGWTRVTVLLVTLETPATTTRAGLGVVTCWGTQQPLRISFQKRGARAGHVQEALAVILAVCTVTHGEPSS